MSARKQRNPDDPYGSDLEKHGGRNMDERLINQARELQPVGLTMVDNPDAVSGGLLTEVQYKAMCWEISYKKLDGSSSGPPYNGQLGLIRGNRITASPQDHQNAKRQILASPQMPPSRFEAIPTTALHNVIDYPHKNEYFGACKIFISTPPTEVINLVFPDFHRSLTNADKIQLIPADTENDVPALTWRSHDVARGTPVVDPTQFLTQKHLSFEKIPEVEGFAITVGLNIGIAVYRNFTIKAADAGASLSEEQLRKLFGERDSVCVLTGEITALHENPERSFEHSINTFRGCSGAIIFLLDQNQPTEAAVRHKGKAIGVHVGGKPVDSGGPPANVGFLL